MKKQVLFKYGFVALLACIVDFALPMRPLCACESGYDLLVMAFEAQNMTDAQLARATRMQMDGFNIKRGVPEWEAELKSQIVTNPDDFGKPDPPGTHSANMMSWIRWFGPKGWGVSNGDCSPPLPWRNGQAVSCEFYKEGNLFKKTGFQLDFRITPNGVIRDIKLSALSNLLGRETREAIQ